MYLLFEMEVGKHARKFVRCCQVRVRVMLKSPVMKVKEQKIKEGFGIRQNR